MPYGGAGSSANMGDMERIVVAIDGSEEATAALEWALAHSDADDVVVVATIWQIPVVYGIDMPILNVDDIKLAAQRLVEETIASVKARDGAPKMEAVVRSGHVGSELVDIAASADQLVLGCRGYGGLKSLMLGSVSTYVLHHAPCPVTVIPAP